jgi:hypothetical protein
MSHPWEHAQITAKKFGGQPKEHHPVHLWFDQSKRGFADHRHRAARHHSEGVFWAESHFGETVTVTRDDGTEKRVPTRRIAEDHVAQDLGWIPSLKDWFQHVNSQKWMRAPAGHHSGSAEESPQTFFLEREDGTVAPTTCAPSEAREEGFLSPEEVAQRYNRTCAQ